MSGVVVGTAVPSNLIPTNETAALYSTGANNKRARPNHMPQATLMPRAVEEVPLAEPNPNDQEGFVMNVLQDAKKINISPSKNQLASWTIPLQIDGKIVNTPIGLTGVWVPFSNNPMNYKMVGMSGCTAVFIVVCYLLDLRSLLANMLIGRYRFLGCAFLGILCT